MRGDYLPEVKKNSETGKHEKHRPVYKDGETPGQEWTSREILAIRALANPMTASPAKAAKISRLTMKKVRRLMRNPFFLNAIYELTTYNLNQYRSRVYGALVKSALGRSFQDRQLFFRLTGELKADGMKKVHHYNHMIEDDGSHLDDVIRRDASDLSERDAQNLENFSRREEDED